MASVEQLTIQFSGKGAGKLTGQLNSLSKAMNRLAARQIEHTKELKKGNKELDSYNERMTKTGRNVKGITGLFGKFGKKMSQMRSQLLIVAFAVGVVGKVLQSLHKAVSEFQVAQGKLNAVLASTGSVSGKTASQLENMANRMQSSMGIANTSIMEMQGRLLTFTSIVGKQFDNTIKVAMDMSAVLGTDLNQATIQIGKALNDPIQGLGALSRVGVSFSKQQKEQIKIMQESGDIVGAQKMVLAELNREFGEASQSIRENAKGTQIAKDLSNEWGDVLREIGFVFEPIINGVMQFARGVVWLTAKLIEGQRGITKWFTSIFINVDEAELAFIQTTNAASTMFTDFQKGLSNYSDEAKSLAMANTDIFTSTKEIQKLTNQLSKEMSDDERQDILDQIAESYQNNTQLLMQHQTAIDTEKKAVDDSVASLEYKIAVLDVVTEAERMAMEITKNRENGIKDLTNREKKLIEQYLKTKKALEDKTQAEKDAEAQVNAEIKAVIDLHKTQKASEKSLKATAEALSFKNTFGREMNETEKLMAITTRDITAAEWEYAEAIDNVNQKIKEQNEANEEKKEADEIRKEAMGEFMDKVSEVAQHQIDTARAVADAKIEAINRTEQIELGALRNTWLYQKMTDKQKADAEKKIKDKAEKERKKAKKIANKEMAKQFEVQKAMQIAETIMSTQAAVMKTLAKGVGFFSTPLAMIVAGMGAASVAMIAAQKPPKMQYGGLIGGRRHSAGGTMIEAEQGEFVMSRDATEAIGIENLNRMNTAGGGGGASIIINNPILGKDTIEDEIVPQIKEALRRGGDIGIG